MIEAKQLIEMNNHRRTELTPENEKYYTDFLLYIRLHLFLSEQQSEEILMEILDHLIEGQKEGKTAAEIFGNNPKRFADELIEQLPRENRKNLAKFFSEIALNLLGYFLLIRGVIIFGASFFKDVNITVYPVKTSIIVFLIVGFSLFGVRYIFKIINHSLFKEKNSSLSDSVKAGLYGAVSMGIVIAAGYFLPGIGPSMDFAWYTSLISGAVIWGVSRILKNV
ncbi:DUF1129 family protein [Neobacillus mesonae]|uniref:DUF1129 family protein n=1 Tax=Neobacillus mesonae TaxID=1193713 RepID=UPI0020403B86|nr:DUF1129 family protein [Neobacillus mesonae]MCM3566683.1 DUF1129 domain-containing protein [Neobacillus mesonae]